MKYVDAEKLIAEIEALKRRKGFLPFENTEITEAYMARGVQFTCDDIVNLIQSLQQEQPEVDLWKEIHKYFNPHEMALQFDRSKGNTILKPEQLFDFARHFWNQGYNARNEK